MVGAHQNLNGSRDLTMPLSGTVCHPWASTWYHQPIYQIWSLLTTLLTTKTWKVIQNVEIGWFGSLKVTENRINRYSTCIRVHISDLAFHSNYVLIMHRFWDTARYWLKITVWTYPTSIWRRCWRWFPSQFRRDFRHQKTRVTRLSFGTVCVILLLAILVQCWLVTNKQTHDDRKYRAGLRQPRDADTSRPVSSIWQRWPSHAPSAVAKVLRSQRESHRLVYVVSQRPSSACSHNDVQFDASSSCLWSTTRLSPRTDLVSPVHCRPAAAH